MILFLLPDSDYDPTESAVPWDALQHAGIEVRFATPQGLPAYADPRLVSGGFGLLNSFFMTKSADLQCYQRMSQSAAFLKPLSYAEALAADFEAVLVPGGHAQGVRSLLESELYLVATDLDGTLAHYEGWVSTEHIGKPVPKMVNRVKRWLSEDRSVRIFTARVCNGDAQGCRPIIEAWCLEHIG